MSASNVTTSRGALAGQRQSVQTYRNQPLVTPENAPRGALLVSPRQDGNPVLRQIRSVRWMFGSITPDYQIGHDGAALYLSLRYHLLNPEYIYHRMRELQRSYTLRVILCHVDVEDMIAPLEEVTSAALHNRFTLVCCFSVLECARYLETYKCYEHKPADAIKGRTETDYESRRSHVLTAVRGVNKTDVVTLGSRMGSVAGIMKADKQSLAACPGIGPTKVDRLYDAFNLPFKKNQSVKESIKQENKKTGNQNTQEEQ